MLSDESHEMADNDANRGNAAHALCEYILADAFTQQRWILRCNLLHLPIVCLLGAARPPWVLYITAASNEKLKAKSSDSEREFSPPKGDERIRASRKERHGREVERGRVRLSKY
jgi:hypothetical protein